MKDRKAMYGADNKTETDLQVQIQQLSERISDKTLSTAEERKIEADFVLQALYEPLLVAGWIKTEGGGDHEVEFNRGYKSGANFGR